MTLSFRPARRLRAFAHVALLAAWPLARAGTLNPADTAVQMFQWRWDDLATECAQWLGPQGYGAVQVSPPAAARTGDAWWLAYQPVNYASLSGRFGDKAQFTHMISACHKAGVRVYADIVVNQLAGSSSDAAGLATDGSAWNSAALAYPAFGPADFHAACTIQPADYQTPAGRANVENCRLSADLPDLDSEGAHARAQVVAYLDKLLSLGVDGFRIDAAKHQAPASLQAMLASVKAAHPLTKQGEPVWITQEIIPDGEAVRADWFVNGTLNEFLFTYLMQQAWRDTNGASPSTIPAMMGTPGHWGGSWGFLQPANATVFVNNWDTERDGSSLDASNFTGAVNDTQGSHRYELANVFMLAQPYGQAMVHSGFRFSNRDAGPPAASPYVNGVAQVNVEWDFIHRWSAISNMVRFRSATAGQPQANWVSDHPDHIAFSRGNVGFAAFNNTTTAWTHTFATGLKAGTYCNVVHGLKNAAATACSGDTVTVDAAGNATLAVAADGGAAVPAVAIYTGQKIKAAATTCAVRFSIAAATAPGQGVYVVGNDAALGNWSPAAGFALTVQGSGTPATWAGTAPLEADTALQYKYVKWDGTTATWEGNQATSSGNREFTTCAAGAKAKRQDGDFAP